MPAKTYSFTCSFTPESGEDSPFFSVSYTLTIRYAKIVGAHVTGSNFLPGAISKYRYKGKEYTPSFRGGVSPFCVSQFKILPI
jgi:hypothetical protein